MFYCCCCWFNSGLFLLKEMNSTGSSGNHSAPNYKVELMDLVKRRAEIAVSLSLILYQFISSTLALVSGDLGGVGASDSRF